MTVTYPDGLTNAFLELGHSSDLQTWTYLPIADATVVSQSASEGWRTVRLRDVQPLAQTGRRFLRLRASEPRTLFAYEGFNYATGDLSALTPHAGTGWSGNWSTDDDVVSPGLAYGSLAVTGNAFAADASPGLPIRAFNRVFGAAGDENKTVWIAVLHRNSGADGTSGQPNVFGSLRLRRSGTTRVEFGQFYRTWRLKSGEAAELNSNQLVTAGTHLYVLKIEFGGTPGLTGGDDTVSFYLDPPLGQEPATPFLQQTGVSIEFDALQLNAAGSIHSFDEIRVGDAWQVVLP